VPAGRQVKARWRVNACLLDLKSGDRFNPAFEGDRTSPARGGGERSFAIVSALQWKGSALDETTVDAPRYV